MATRQHILDFILEQMSGVRDVTARKMFGEFAIYSTGKVVALVCDDQLFVKPTDPGKKFIGTVTEGAPYPGAKPCFLVEGDQWEDGDWLSELIRLTANALPLPKPKPASSRAVRPVTRSTSGTRLPGEQRKTRAKPKASNEPRPATSPKRQRSAKPPATPKRKRASQAKAK